MGSEGLLEGLEGLPAGPEGLPGGQGGGIDEWTEFHPIPQDFVPCQGRCPKIDESIGTNGY